MGIFSKIRNKLSKNSSSQKGGIKYFDEIAQGLYSAYLAEEGGKAFDVSEKGVVTERVYGEKGLIKRVSQPIRSTSAFMADTVSESYEGIVTDIDQKDKYVYVSILSDVQDIDHVEYSGVIKDGDEFEAIETIPTKSQMLVIKRLVSEFEKLLVKADSTEENTQNM